MKKLIFLIALLSCYSFVFAQQKNTNTGTLPKERKVFFSVMIGPTVDWFQPTTKAFSGKVATGGFLTGITIDANVIPQKFFYISTGVLVRYLEGIAHFNHEYTVNDKATIEYAKRTYQTIYLTFPTGIKLKTKPSKNCVFSGKVGLYHNFKIVGQQVDNFVLKNDPEYFITTKKIKNTDAALFAEAGYAGLGFEYVLGKTRVFANVDYSCQFNYFNKKATSNISDARFKTVVHSLQMVFGFLF